MDEPGRYGGDVGLIQGLRMGQGRQSKLGAADAVDASAVDPSRANDMCRRGLVACSARDGRDNKHACYSTLHIPMMTGYTFP